jgi:hypothetical protein
VGNETVNRIPKIAIIDKGTECYVLRYTNDDHGRREALKQLGRWASDCELTFNWYDAACASKKIRETVSA